MRTRTSLFVQRVNHECRVIALDVTELGSSETSELVR